MPESPVLVRTELLLGPLLPVLLSLAAPGEGSPVSPTYVLVTVKPVCASPETAES